MNLVQLDFGRRIALISTKKCQYFLVPVLLVALALVSCQGAAVSEVRTHLAPTGTAYTLRTITPLPTVTPIVVSGTVSVWHSWEEPYIPALLRRIYEFGKLYPNVYFDVTYVPEIDLRLAYEQAASEGRSPTLLIGQAEWGPALFDKGLVADLSSLVGAELLNTLNPAAVGTGRYREALVSVPVDIRGVVLYRNQGIIPIAPSTFEELVSLAQEATRGQTVGAVLDRSFFFSGAHLVGLGGSLMTSEGEPDFLNLKGLEWVSLLQAYSEAGPTEYFSDNDLNLFKEKHAGFIIEGTWNRLALAEAIGVENLAIDPWPIHAEGSLSGFVQSESIYLSTEALQEPYEASLKFLLYFLTPESQAAVAQVGLIPAINGSPVNLAANQLRIEDALLAQAMRALADGITYPVLPVMSAYTSQMDIALNSIFDDGIPAEQALQRADEVIRAALVTPTP
jgi:arabinogalactan oligomer/maltooligosaccharide transport system substrate-binding protein